jgi:hypothetical protein
MLNQFNQNPYYKNPGNFNLMGQNGFNLGDSFIPGLQKQNLGSKKLIWDDHPDL